MRWLTKKKTMMVGIDVTHPGPGSRDGTPSIAAVVANVDDSFVQFPASIRIQQSKKEASISAPNICKAIQTDSVIHRCLMNSEICSLSVCWCTRRRTRLFLSVFSCSEMEYLRYAHEIAQGAVALSLTLSTYLTGTV